MFPSDLTPDDIVRARRKAMQEEAMLKAMQEGQRADETPEELRAAMGDIAAQFAAQEARCSTAAPALATHHTHTHHPDPHPHHHHHHPHPLLLLRSRDPPVTRPCP